MKNFNKFTAFLLTVLLFISCIALSGCSPIRFIAAIANSFSAEDSTTLPSSEPAAPVATASSVAKTYFTTPWHADVNYNDMEYVHYDIETFNTAMDDFTAAVQSGKAPFSEIQEKYDALYAEVMTVSTLYSLAEIKFYDNTSDQTWIDEHDHSYTTYLDVSDQASSVICEALQSSYANDLTAYIGEDAATDFLEYAEMTDRESELLDRENELTTQYEQKIVENVTITFDGSEWTFDELNAQSDSLSYDDYYTIAYALEEEQNAEVGDIFLELVAVRTELAKIYGYDNYSDYAYAEIYGRDYTTQDAEAFCETVKTAVSPQYFSDSNSSNAGYYEFSEDAVFTDLQILQLLKEYGGRLSPEISTVADYLSTYELYDISESDVGSDIGYTTTLNAYQEPFLYNRLYGDPSDVNAVIHEFGHCIDAYYTQQQNILTGDCSYDIAEVHSQGLECLFDTYCDEIFSEEDALPLRIQHLSNLLSIVVSGCIEDEFQREIYANPDMTLEEMNQTYHEIYTSYGYEYDYDMGLDYEWIYINHTFTSPMYYISYATSALTALDIWTDAQNSEADALDKYLTFTSYGSYDYGYIELLNQCGFGNFTQDGYVEEVTQPVIEKLQEMTDEYDLLHSSSFAA